MLRIGAYRGSQFEDLSMLAATQGVLTVILFTSRGVQNTTAHAGSSPPRKWLLVHMNKTQDEINCQGTLLPPSPSLSFIRLKIQ